MALSRGEIDWAGSFLPAIDQVFVDKDPDHHHYWHPMVGASVFLFPNTARPPLTTPRFAKPSVWPSIGILWFKSPCKPCEPADTGLSPAYDRWKSEEVLNRPDWTQYDPSRRGLLDAAGYPADPNGRRNMNWRCSCLRMDRR